MFITLEGPDGSGKSSQIQPLSDYLTNLGYAVFTTQEPGGTKISNQVKDILKSMSYKDMMHPRTEILLFCSARAQLVEEFIRPHLEAGHIIISDRYADSTLAYQGYGHGYDLKLLKQLLDFATGSLWPSLTILLDIDAEEGLRRRKIGGEEWDRLDDYELAFHKRVREGYLELASQEPERWCKINANQSPENVQSMIREAITSRLPMINK